MENSTNNPTQEPQENSQEAQATQTSTVDEAAQSATSPGGKAQVALGEERGGNYFLGKTCRDIVSGFEGICIGIVEWRYTSARNAGIR